MFENPKYITRGVQGEIPDALMLLMWQMIAAMRTAQKDYLQVFTLTKTSTGQHSFHKASHLLLGTWYRAGARYRN